MRTTVTIDDDVAVRLEQERRKRRLSFKEIVNDVLRAGLGTLGQTQRRHEQFRTSGFDLGQSLVGSLDNVEEVLSHAQVVRRASPPASRRRSALPTIAHGGTVVANVTADGMAQMDEEGDRHKLHPIGPKRGASRRTRDSRDSKGPIR